MRTDLDPDEMGTRPFYKILTSVVVPRPIAWVSTRSADGVDNLAPHSFFTVSCVDPPMVQFTSIGVKDSLRNVRATGEFVVCLAPEPLFIKDTLIDPKNARPGQQAGTKTCSWSANKPTHQVVSLMYSPPGDWNTRKTRQMPGVTKASVSGVGDEAFAETAGNFTTLYVKKGSMIFMVRVYGAPDVGRQLAIEKPIAQTVAAKV